MKKSSSFQTENFRFVDFIEMPDSLCRQVWECRNRSEIRCRMDNQNPISWESHLQFVDSLRNKSDVKYYVVLSASGEFMGSVNIHFSDAMTVERGIYLNPDFWGKGLSKCISSEFYSYIHENMGVNKVMTKVLRDNAPSNHLQLAMGGKMTHSDDTYNYYSIELDV